MSAVPSSSGLIRAYRSARASADLGTRIIWWAIPLTAAIIGIVVLVWVVPVLLAVLDGSPPPRDLHRNALQPGVMVLHALPAVIALLIGPWQLSAFLRASYPRLHRWLGRVYVGLVLPAAGASLFLLAKADLYGEDFVLSVAGVVWGAFTIIGVIKIRQRDVAAHRRWMMRSYAFTWASITIRLYYMIAGDILGVSFNYRYAACLWLAFITNLLVVEWIIRRKGLRKPNRAYPRADPVHP